MASRAAVSTELDSSFRCRSLGTISDVPAETIRALAMEYATTEHALLAPGWGINRQESGEHASVMLPIALASMKGELGMDGGGLSVYIWGGHGRPKSVGRGPGRLSAGMR